MQSLELTSDRTLTLVPPPSPSQPAPIRFPVEVIDLKDSPPAPLAPGFEPLPSQGPELQRLPTPETLMGAAAAPRFPIDLPALLRTLEEIAREKAHLDADEDLIIDVYPRPKRTLVQSVVSQLSKDEEGDSDTRLPGLSELLGWYRTMTIARHGAQALLPYTIRIE